MQNVFPSLPQQFMHPCIHDTLVKIESPTGFHIYHVPGTHIYLLLRLPNRSHMPNSGDQLVGSEGTVKPLLTMWVSQWLLFLSLVVCQHHAEVTVTGTITVTVRVTVTVTVT